MAVDFGEAHRSRLVAFQRVEKKMKSAGEALPSPRESHPLSRSVASAAASWKPHVTIAVVLIAGPPSRVVLS
jgi:hypothetical protein